MSEAITPDEQKIIEFKNYLKSLGKYSGDINSSEPDNDFISEIKLLENELSDAINNKSIIGLIWQGNKINPQTSVADVTAAIDILKKKGLLKSAKNRMSFNKSAQATVDTFNVEEYMDSPPSATKTVLTADETNIEHGDPANSQQIGKSVVELPKTASMDDRIIEFVKFFA